jgi:hypothetical protein
MYLTSMKQLKDQTNRMQAIERTGNYDLAVSQCGRNFKLAVKSFEQRRGRIKAWATKSMPRPLHADVPAIGNAMTRLRKGPTNLTFQN